VLVRPSSAGAHAFLERSDPLANAVLPEAPDVVSLWFTEPIEPDFSRARLFDANGQQVETPDSQLGAEPNQLILRLPPALPRGTYTIQWSNVSAADGHPQVGFVPFTIGSQSDVVVPTAPDVSQFNAPPTWLAAVGRWLSLLGACGAAGLLLCWLLVIQPASRDLDDAAYDRVQSHVYRLAIGATGVGLLGSLVALGVQTATVGDLSLGNAWDVLIDTSWGFYWLARVALLAVLSVIFTTPTLWDDPPPRLPAVGGLVVAGAVLVPFALISHAAAQSSGKPAAVASDWLHLASSAVWVGGLLALLAGLVYGTRGLQGRARRQAYASAIPRFTTLALVSVVILVASGFYSAWLEIGNLTALTDTDYGRTLLVKLALMVPMLGLGLLNQRVIGPRLRHSAGTGKQFGRSIATEALLGVGVLFVAGLLTALPTGREAITAEQGRNRFHWAEDGLHVALIVSPGAVGLNRYTVDVATDTGTLAEGSEVLLRVSREDDNVAGVREVALQPQSDVRYEGGGSELSVVGDWQLELIVRQPGTEDWRRTQTMDIAATPPAERIPGEPPRFAGVNAGLAVLFAGLGIVAIAVGARRETTLRDVATYAGFGLGLLITSALILTVTYVAPPRATRTAPVERSAGAISEGGRLFLQNCASCHGESGQGDGPQSEFLEVHPANLTQAHVDTHTDSDLYWWIQNGIEPAMPGFDEQLTEEQIWQLIYYVRSLRGPGQGGP
jgi:copper transport protein